MATLTVPTTKAVGQYTRPWLYEKQAAAIFDPARYSLIEATSKGGKTVGCIVWITEKAMAGRAGQNFWWIAPVFSQAKVAFRRLKRALPRGVFVANETEMTITLANGAVIWFKSGEKPDTLYGEDVYAAVIDEASRCREEAWHAIRSTLTATRGPIRLIGNVKGRRNWFWRMCRKAEGGEKGMAYHRLTAQDAVEAGVLDAEEIESARRDLPEAVFRELYEAQASDDQGNPFGMDAIAACAAPGLSKLDPVCYGWDLAKSVDWTVGIGLDAYGHVATLARFQAPWEVTLRRVADVTGSTRALVDSSGVGDPIVESLQHIPNTRIEGFKFTQQSKQALMEGLAVAIQKREVTFPDGVIRAELESFEYTYGRTGVSYSAPAGLHDDAVCALALAVKMKRDMTLGGRVAVRVVD